LQPTLMSSKGQVIIPKPLREANHWRAGTRLQVVQMGDGVLLKPMQVQPKSDLALGLAAIRARLAYRGPVVSLQEMDAAVQREAARFKPKG
jgi:AbrB family looped-hinge helix DNA binding protein